MKASCKTLREWEKEESETSKKYRKYGFPKQAKDEMGHSKYFRREQKKRGCK